MMISREAAAQTLPHFFMENIADDKWKDLCILIVYFHMKTPCLLHDLIFRQKLSRVMHREEM